LIDSKQNKENKMKLTENDMVMSKKSYASEKAALKAAAKTEDGLQRVHKLPSGRFCYMRAIHWKALCCVNCSCEACDNQRR